MRWHCVAYHFQDEWSKVKVRWVIWSFYYVRFVAPSILYQFTSYEIHIPPITQCVVHHFQIKRSRSHKSCESFCLVSSVASSLFDQFTSCVAYIQHMRGRCVMHHFQDKRSAVKVTWVVSSFGPVCSVALSLFDRITSYEAYIQHMGGRCVMPHFQDERSRWHRSFPVLARALCGFVPVWLNHFICGIHTTHDGTICHTLFFRMKGQRSRSHGSLEVFTWSAPWLPPYLTESLHMWHTFNKWGGDVWHTIDYNHVIISVIASQINSISIWLLNRSYRHRSKKTSKGQ